MAFNLTEKTLVRIAHMVELPPERNHPKGGNFMGLVMRDGDGVGKGWVYRYRFRFYRDEKIHRSSDERSFFIVEPHSDEWQSSDELVRTAKVLSTSMVGKFGGKCYELDPGKPITGPEFGKLLTSQPWAHKRSLD